VSATIPGWIPSRRGNKPRSRFAVQRAGIHRCSGSAVPGLPLPEEAPMLAAIGLGLIGTVIVIALIIAVVIWFLNRA